MPAPAPQSIFKTARLLGDFSSLKGGAGGVTGRATRRLVGMFSGGKAMFGLNLWGLVMWAEFFTFLTNAVEEAFAKERWVGTYAPYAAGYEHGFTESSGGRTKRSFFFPAVAQVIAERSGGGLSIGLPSFSRSGVYAGGRFLSDIRSVADGSLVSRRIPRRLAGRAYSRFVWGTLSDPTKNVFDVMARKVVVLARRNAKKQGLLSSGALVASIAVAETEQQLRELSIMRWLAQRQQDRGKLYKNEVRALSGLMGEVGIDI